MCGPLSFAIAGRLRRSGCGVSAVAGRLWRSGCGVSAMVTLWGAQVMLWRSKSMLRREVLTGPEAENALRG